MENTATKQDIEQTFSGVIDWQWDNGMSFDGLCQFVRQSIDTDVIVSAMNDSEIQDSILVDYILANNADPKDYSF